MFFYFLINIRFFFGHITKIKLLNYILNSYTGYNLIPNLYICNHLTCLYIKIWLHTFSDGSKAFTCNNLFISKEPVS